MRHASPRPPTPNWANGPPPAQAHVPKPSSKRVHNLPIAGIDIGRRHHIKPSKATKNFSGLVASFGNSIQKLGGGEYAAVYIVDVNSHSLQTLRALEGSVHNLVRGSPFPSSGKIILKIGVPDHGERWEAFLQRSTRENAAHLAVQRVDASVVPALFFSGSTGMSYVTAMAVAEGVTLGTYLKQHGGKLSQHVYDNLQKAVITSLSAGIVHGDLHDENVLVSPDGRVKLIDFGFAVQLSPQQIADVKKVVHQDTDLAWQKIGNYVNAVQAQRIHGLSWYNPEVKALKVWKSLVVSDPTSVLSPLSSGASSRHHSSSSRHRSSSRKKRTSSPRKVHAMQLRARKELVKRVSR